MTDLATTPPEWHDDDTPTERVKTVDRQIKLWRERAA